MLIEKSNATNNDFGRVKADQELVAFADNANSEKPFLERVSSSTRVQDLFSKEGNKNPELKEKTINELTGWDKFMRTAKIWAKIFDSRASTYRAIMDLIGADIPTVIGGMRNIYSFIEQSVEAAESFVMVFAAPQLTKFVAKLIAKIFLPEIKDTDVKHHLLFHRAELHDNESFKKAISRIKDEEVNDKKHIGDLYRELGKTEKAKGLDQECQGIKDYCEKFGSEFLESHKDSPEDNDKLTAHRQELLKLKEAVQLGESLVEGGLWGSFGISMRLFRKYILRQDSFTGTAGYASKEEQKKIGDSKGIGFKEIFGALVGVTISPIINKLVIDATRDREKVKNSKWLSFLDHQFDMTHGLYPRLGMMFSFMVIPKWTSVFLTSQGKNELLEKLSKALSMIPLWWLGQKITNGPLAAMRDNAMQKKHGTKPGLLVNRPESPEPGLIGMLKHYFPEAQKYYDVYKKLENEPNQEIKEEAFDKHAKTVYQGLGLHTFLVFSAIMISQWLTKRRVAAELAEKV